MSTDTQRRVGVHSGVIADFQSGKGVPVDDFSAARNLWASPVDLDYNVAKTEPSWMSERAFDRSGRRFNRFIKPFGSFTSVATPKTLDYLFRSNWGTPVDAGPVRSYTLTAGIPEFLSLCYLEDRFQSNRGNLIRFADAWVYRLTLVTVPDDGLVRAVADWAARSVKHFPLNEGLVPLPAYPIGPDDAPRFDSRSATLTRDPGGVAQDFDFQVLRLEIDQGLIHRYEMSDGVNIRKGGKAKVAFGFTTRVNDEGFEMLNRSLEATAEPWTLSISVPGARLEVEMSAVEFVFDPIGREGKEPKRITVVGRALEDAAGNDVVISLTGV